MNKGFIIINRRIEDHWIWTDKPYSKGQAWIDLILMANYADSSMLIKGQIVEIKRGQVLRTIGFLSERWGWSAKKVRSFIDQLRGQQMVTPQGTPQGTLITIENYTFWQTLGQESGQQEGQQKGQAREHKRIKNNKYKQKNNNKGCRRPSFEEVADYVRQMNYDMDPEVFYDYYSEVEWTKKNGQPIKDWKATVRSWERRSKKWQAEADKVSGPRVPDYKPVHYEGVAMPDEMRKQIEARRRLREQELAKGGDNS